MTDLRTAALQALEALKMMRDEYEEYACPACDHADAAIYALRAALEEPVQEPEPVAWASKRTLNRIKDFDGTIYANGGFDDAVPLYTALPCDQFHADELTVAYTIGAQSRMRTLTDEIIAELWYKNGTHYHHFARAIERWLKGEQ